MSKGQENVIEQRLEYFFLLNIFIHFMFYNITPGILVRQYNAII
jgi:hypothetical protein